MPEDAGVDGYLEEVHKILNERTVKNGDLGERVISEAAQIIHTHGYLDAVEHVQEFYDSDIAHYAVGKIAENRGTDQRDREDLLQPPYFEKELEMLEDEVDVDIEADVSLSDRVLGKLGLVDLERIKSKSKYRVERMVKSRHRRFLRSALDSLAAYEDSKIGEEPLVSYEIAAEEFYIHPQYMPDEQTAYEVWGSLCEVKGELGSDLEEIPMRANRNFP